MRRAVRKLVWGAGIAAAIGIGPAIAEADDLSELMTILAARKASEAHFVERRYLAMLSEPLKSTGTLSFVAPAKLEKVTLSPQQQRLLVDGDRLVVDPGPEGGPKTLSLAQQPEIGAFVEAIRGTLAGDLAALERHYLVRLEGGLSDWTLLLEPTEAATRRLLSTVSLKGKRAEIQAVEIRETDGDRTEMIILGDPR